MLMAIAGLSAMPRAVNAQAADRVYRIGYLNPATAEDPDGAFLAVRQALAALGYSANRNIRFEERFAGGKLHIRALLKSGRLRMSRRGGGPMCAVLPLSRAAFPSRAKCRDRYRQM